MEAKTFPTLPSHQLKLPGQFKPNRSISDGPWRTYIERALSRQSLLTIEDLNPTQEDLELISSLAYVRDDLADDLATLIFKNRNIAQQFEKGLAEGIASLENPPEALVKFLDYYENMPDWTYMGNLQKEMATEEGKVFLNAARTSPQTPSYHKAIEEGIRLTAGFFVGAYYPAVGQSIVSTGSVAKGSNRVIQTFKFFDDTSDVRDYMPFGKAVQAGAKVRLGHAFARKQIEKTGTWDKAYYGEIISNFDNMIFASGIILGVNATQSSEFKKYGVNQGKAMTYFLGAPSELLQLSQPDIHRFFLMCVSHLDGSPSTASAVYEAFKSNDHYKPTKTLRDKFYKQLTYLSANLITRIIWGNEIATGIKMEKTFYGFPLVLLANYLSKRINVNPTQPNGAATKHKSPLMAPVRYIINVLIQKIFSPPKPSVNSKALETEPYQGSMGVFGKSDNKENQ